MLELREPTAADRRAIGLVGGLSFNSRAKEENTDHRGALCLFDVGRAVAYARAIPLAQWFGGNRLGCAAVADVAVLPEYRGQGAATMLMTALLTGERDRGTAISALYPGNVTLYRRLGYEYAGLRPQFRVLLTDLPAARGEVRELSEGELGEVVKCFERFAVHHNGPVQELSPAHWMEHVLGQSSGGFPRTVVVPGDDGLAGYASYYLGNVAGGGYQVVCRHFIALNLSALDVAARVLPAVRECRQGAVLVRAT